MEHLEHVDISANMETTKSIETAVSDPITRLMEVVLPPACEDPESFWNVPAMLLNDATCFKATLSRVLGFGIVLFAGLIKFPQIAAILSAKSVAGLSITTFLVETFGLSYNLAAHYRQNYPVSTYGDFVVLIMQNFVLLYLCYAYTGRTALGLSVIGTYVATLILMCSPLFPVEILKIMTLANVAVVVVGRVPQIYANFNNGTTGTLSVITCWGIFLGASARIFTTLQDVGSFNILAGYLVSALLNGIIAFQVVYYRYLKPQTKVEKAKKTE